MLDHMTFRVSDIARTKTFYTPVLATLGYSVAYEAEHNGSHMIGYGFADAHVAGGMTIDTWFIDGPSPYGGHPVTTGCHLCWRAAHRAAVDAFYQAAIKQGGKDNGVPGVRAHYHPHYYGAFVIDPDGNNIEAVCHLPA
jgi:catechol 2,3-dioxygenase-like lactoylglutathione lyase family enzyme